MLSIENLENKTFLIKKLKIVNPVIWNAFSVFSLFIYHVFHMQNAIQK